MFKKLRERLSSGLAKTRQAITGGLSRVVGRKVDAELLDEVEEVLIGADLGVELASELRDRLEENARGKTVESTDQLLDMLHAELEQLLPQPVPQATVDTPPRVTLMIGVNGSGKTTTTGKLASRWANNGREVVVAAADTFRAAAVEQLATWAERSGARVVRARPGTDPAAVAFDAVESGRARNVSDVIVDTAGRLHTKKNLMDELAKIVRAVQKAAPGAPHDTLLVLDGTTGRNAILQAREFARAAEVTGLVLTKLDGTAKGGVAVAIGRELNLPVRYIGVGEGAEDLLDFDAREYIAGLLAHGDGQADKVSEPS